MKISKCTFDNWKTAYKLTTAKSEMIIGTDKGPRILSLRLNKNENILFVDAAQKLGRDKWKIYGGHRIWLAPETETCYAPDNAACDVKIEKEKIIITAPIDSVTQTQKVLIVSETKNGFSVTSSIKNVGVMLMTGSVWALTCVRTDAKVFFPWGRPGNWEMKKICWWKGWAGHGSNIVSLQWQPTNDLFIINPTGEEGKVGTGGYDGWIAAAFPALKITFIKKFQYQHNANYIDEGCALQCYTCNKFIELETLSPYQTIYPGETISHTEEWILIPEVLNPFKPSTIEKILDKI